MDEMSVQIKIAIPFFLSLSNGSKMNGSLEHLDQPDPDSIKMFVGQIPRSWSETELKELFEPFGAVHQINILRDRTQNPPQSKGMGGARTYSCYFWYSWWISLISNCKIHNYSFDNWSVVFFPLYCILFWLFDCYLKLYILKTLYLALKFVTFYNVLLAKQPIVN